ncbi:M30 family zinc metallopeptidase [Chitiniphilus eburneus]|uniref:Uncharacterized protein n=1 Tax=Chitiniphilus eburneus TaxID=2571148 RepID=A0A4U0PUH0_9NEIS|nr:hypothetical protein [Chitiniphilus eburneus]TJZ72077.1 hypothetical protein FAZ21_13195 [Chitiniphilus eburneus]
MDAGLFKLGARRGALLVSLWLAACGGGGGDEAGSAAPEVPEAPAASVQVACTGVGCDASGTGYGGHGLAILVYRNTGDVAAPASLRLEGTSGRTVTLVLGNGSAQPQVMPAQSAALAAVVDVPQAIPARTASRNPFRNDFGVAGTPRTAVPALAWQVGDMRNWIDEEDSAHRATLLRQTRAGDGRVVNLWLEDGEAGGGRVTDAMLDNLIARVAGSGDAAYELVTRLVGPVWGEQPYPHLLPADAPLDVVLLNIDRDGAPWGRVGYFWSRNNLLRQVRPQSNEALAIFLDTETLYLGGDIGRRYVVSTLAHELTHMANFYRRGVGMAAAGDYVFDTWLEELTAMMAEDLLSARLTPGFNATRDMRLPNWLKHGAYNCDVTAFDERRDATCYGYNVAGSYAGYLLRQYGPALLQRLSASQVDTDSKALFEQVLGEVGGIGLAESVRRWQASVALLATDAPVGYGYPARSEAGYALPGIDGRLFSGTRVMPTALPVRLAPYGAAALEQRDVAAPYAQTIQLPARGTLTVVVQ